MFKSEKGFTFLELIIIFVFLSLFSGLVAIKMTGILSSYHLRTNTVQVLSLLRKTKQLAITRQYNYGLQLINTDQFAIYREDASGYLQKLNLDSDIKASSSRESKKIVFYPLGNASAGTIFLVNKQGASYQIKISVTGRISFAKG